MTDDSKPDDVNPPTTPAGWYRDVNRADTERYWDGATWTPATRTASSEADAPGARSNWSNMGGHSHNQHLNAQPSISDPVVIEPLRQPQACLVLAPKPRNGLFWWVAAGVVLWLVVMLAAAGKGWDIVAQLMFLPLLAWWVYVLHQNSKSIVRPALICPHCQQKGAVSTKTVKRKQGISGGKAAGAIFTGGVSMLATGLSRKQGAQECRCGNCGMTWDIY